MSLRIYVACLLITVIQFVMLPERHLIGQEEAPRVMTGVRFDGNTSVISFVVPGGPAERAGVQIGDEILTAEDRYVVQSIDLIAALKEKEAGHTIKLEILRNGTIHFFELRLIDAVKGDVVIGDDGKVFKPPTKLGVLNEIGPELKVKQWYGIKAGKSARLKDNRGKVICMLLFQTDCEFTQIRGLPELKAIQDEFANDPDVFVFAVQTPFRNFRENTHGAAIQKFEQFGLTVPLGHDGDGVVRSVTYESYRAYGTPWFIVIDKKGVVHFNDTSLPIKEARDMFEMLKARPETLQSETQSKTKFPGTSKKSRDSDSPAGVR